MRDPRSILITGASSGLGAALAAAYAAPGATLHLAGRDRARLAAVAQACERAGAAVRTGLVDVTDRDAVAGFVRDSHAAAPLELVVANAGISGGTGGPADTGRDGAPGEDEAQARRIFQVNLEGVLNTAFPAVPCLAETGGQLAIVSSLAGHRGWPGAPAYSASKAAVKAWGEALRGDLAHHGVTVSVVMPGFVESGITAANDFPMPLLMPADTAARLIRRRLARGPARIAFPWPMALASWLAGALPPALVDRALARLPRKPARRD